MADTGFLKHVGDAYKTPSLRFATPGELAVHQDPKTRTTPALDIIDAALVEAFNTPDARLILNMAPQEGKTQRAAKDFPLWCLIQNPELRVIIASHGSTLAEETGKNIRDRITNDPSLGIKVAHGSSSVKKWNLAGHRGGVFSVGMLGGSAGHPADVLVIDDPFPNRAAAMSVTLREKIWNAWTGDFGARLAPGAPVVLMMTRWHEDDLAGRLVERNPEANWRVINIPAQADHDPAKGETDILGREPGEYMNSSRGRTKHQWDLRKAQAGSRDWNAQYQGRPSAQEGGTFKRRWFSDNFWRDRPYIANPDGTCTITGDGWTVIQSWDMAFKDTKSSDYVVGQVWAKRGADAYLLDQFRARADFTATETALVQMHAKWPQATTILVEDKANGPAVINRLKHVVPGIIAVNPRGSKEARAAASTPFCEAGNVHLPLNEAFTDALVEEAAGFPTAAHDDQVDALTQAIDRLFITAGQGSAFLGAWRADAEKRGLEVSTHARNWRDNIPKRPERA